MKQDPRDKNTWFDAKSAASYLHGYADAMAHAVKSISAENLERAVGLVEGTIAKGGHVYAVGNGGSAAIADHLCCDWSKGTHIDNHPPLRSHSLSSNSALFTAMANDFGYEFSFSKQLEILATKNDLLIAISSSGNSPNILNAVVAARKIGMQSIGLSGFKGGELSTAASVSLHVDAHNYGVVEDAHQVLMHTIAQYIFSRRGRV